MKTTLILGIALAVISAAVLGYDKFSSINRENLLQIGPLTATADLRSRCRSRLSSAC